MRAVLCVRMLFILKSALNSNTIINSYKTFSSKMYTRSVISMADIGKSDYYYLQ